MIARLLPFARPADLARAPRAARPTAVSALARPVLAVLALAAALAAGTASAQTEEIGERMTAFRDAYNAQDASAVAALYTEEAALLPQGGAPIIGRGNIEMFYGQSFSAGVGELTVQIVEIDAQGDTIIEIGRTLFTLEDQRIVGRYMHVWKNVGGAWLIHRDIYNIVGQAGPETGDAGPAVDRRLDDA